MVKAASHHGLDRKYKPWRRGKSQNAKGKKGALKQQLRGLKRLLAKKTDDEQEHKAQIQQQIHELEAQIGEKQKIEQQKTNARKSHGVRFLERQRLTRLWQMAAKVKDEKERQGEQNRIGLDMLYVAHYPLQVRYQPLFRKKERILLDGRNLARRAAARGKILRDAKTLERVAWIPTQIYDNCPTEWSNEMERETFGVVAPSSETDPVRNDDRFSSAAATDKHAAIVQAAQAMDAELDAEEEEDEAEMEASDSRVNTEKANKVSTRVKEMEDNGDDSSSSSDGIVSDSEDDDDSDHADPLERPNLEIRKRSAGEATKDDGSLEVPTPHAKATSPKDKATDDASSSSDSSSGSSSSGSSDEDSDDDDGKKMEGINQTVSFEKASKVLDTKVEEQAIVDDINNDDEDDDDFLMAAVAAPDATDIFANAKEHVPSMDEARGDKSQGWATQRQRPGQFKKRRVRK